MRVLVVAMLLAVVLFAPPWVTAELPPAPGELVVQNNIVLNGTSCEGWVTTHYGFAAVNRAGGPVLYPGPNCSVEVGWLRSAESGFGPTDFDITRAELFAEDPGWWPQTSYVFQTDTTTHRPLTVCPSLIEATQYTDHLNWVPTGLRPAWDAHEGNDLEGDCFAGAVGKWEAENPDYALWDRFIYLELWSTLYAYSNKCMAFLMWPLVDYEWPEIDCQSHADRIRNLDIWDNSLGFVQAGTTVTISVPVEARS